MSRNSPRIVNHFVNQIFRVFRRMFRMGSCVPISRAVPFAAAVAAPLLLCQCETQRTVKSTRSSISFDPQAWGSQAGAQPSGSGGRRSKGKGNRIVDSGWEIDEHGNRTAKRSNLHAGERASGIGKEFETKASRFGSQKARTKEFETPEYLKMQDYRGVSDARESGLIARETGRGRPGESGQLFRRGDESESSGLLGLFRTNRNRASDKSFATAPDRVGARGVENAPRADGIQQLSGYRENASLSRDDVKKMLNPGAYARSE